MLVQRENLWSHVESFFILSCVYNYTLSVKRCVWWISLERYQRRFCNRPKMLKCEQNFGRISEGKTISELFEQCSNFRPILKAIANQKTERKIASESSLHQQTNFQQNSRHFSCNMQTNQPIYLFWNNV